MRGSRRDGFFQDELNRVRIGSFLYICDLWHNRRTHPQTLILAILTFLSTFETPVKMQNGQQGTLRPRHPFDPNLISAGYPNNRSKTDYSVIWISSFLFTRPERNTPPRPKVAIRKTTARTT